MRNDNDGGRAQGAVQSVDRALTILQILARDREAGLGEIAEELEVHKSTASRLMSALAAHDLVEQAGSGRTRLGAGIVRLAGAASAGLDLVREAREICQQLAAEANETVNLAVLTDGAAHYIDQVIGLSTITSYNWVGQRIPLHATSSGRVLVSELDRAERGELWGDLDAFTESTTTEVETLERAVEQVREQGYAVVRDELDVGLTAIAAPLRNAHGEMIASVSISGPSYRFEDRETELTRQVVDAAAGISLRLGWSVATPT